ncbi:hypothetical protein MMC17_007613 [Xylographa soralifera]|nr:hypothetical protein [Xylographa soralifera]
MGNDEEERAIVNSLKQTVKHTSRRKAANKPSKHRDPIIRIAPKSASDCLENSSSGPGSSPQLGVSPPLDHGLSQENGVSMLQDGSVDSFSPKHGDHPAARSVLPISADDSVLLMHFLDNVFPLQYPMYKPGILEEGRGWLLTLLLQTEPLYHAALALSAYHRCSVVPAEVSQPYQVAALVQQEKHLEICTTLVHQSAQNCCPNIGLGIVASVVQLVFFELFTGYGNTWQIHLRAAVNMYQSGYKKNLTPFGLAENSRTILCEDRPLLEYEHMAVEEVVSFRFLSGTIIWLDITSSITAGRAPYLLPYHTCIVASNSQTKLEGIMGCRNWVMLLIGRIAALHEHKIQAMRQQHFDCTELKQTVAAISREIQCGLSQMSLEAFNIPKRDSVTMLEPILDLPTLVTHIFAYMASFYLHLVIEGFQKLEKLDTTISEVMRMLQTGIPTRILPALVSPLYVIGSVARQGDEQFFRDIFTSPPLLDQSLKHRGRILPMLEEIWSKRQTARLFAWEDSLELTHDMLLI